MGRIIQFFIRFRNTFCFLFLLSLCIIFQAYSNSYQGNRLNQVTLSLSAGIHNRISLLYDYLNLNQINTKLNVELEKLKELQLYHSTWQVPDEVFDSYPIDTRYKVHQAKVIYNSFQLTNNYFILDKGSLHGIKPDMGVIFENGVLGVVQKVSSNYCRIVSILHSQMRISIRIKRNRLVGILKWSQKNPTSMELLNVQKTSDILLQDTIITSGLSAYFPPDIPVGAVKKLDSLSKDIYFDIEIELFENPTKTRVAYIIEDKGRPEIDSLLTINR